MYMGTSHLIVAKMQTTQSIAFPITMYKKSTLEFLTVDLSNIHL